MLYTPDDKTLLGFSDFIPANNADDTATLEDLGGGGGGGGAGEGRERRISHFKIKGYGGNACPPTLILACVLFIQCIDKLSRDLFQRSKHW